MDEERRIEEDGRLVIYKRPDSKFYQMRARPEGSDRYVIKSLKTMDFVKAVTKARKDFHKMEGMLDAGISIHNSSMDSLIRDYLKYMKERAAKDLMSKHVAKTQTSFINSNIAEFFKDKILQKLDETVYTEYQEWRTARNAGKIGRVTMKMELSTIKSIMTFGASKKLIRLGDVASPKLVKGLTNEIARRPAFTEDELVTIYEKLRAWPYEPKHGGQKYSRMLIRAYVMILSMTGMRTNDTIDLKWKHIQIFRKVVNQRSAWYASIMVSGKPTENRPEHEVIGQPHCVDQIETWKKLCKWTDPDDLVFCYNRGIPWEADEAFKGMLKDFGMLNNRMGAKRTPYSLRHTYATIRIIAGVPLSLLAQQMGTSIQMLEKHYNHSKLREEAHKLSSGMLYNIVDEFKGLKIIKSKDKDEEQLDYDPSFVPHYHEPIVNKFFNEPKRTKPEK